MFRRCTKPRCTRSLSLWKPVPTNLDGCTETGESGHCMAHNADFGYPGVPVTLVERALTVLGWLPGPLPVGSRKAPLDRLTGLRERVGLPHISHRSHSGPTVWPTAFSFQSSWRAAEAGQSGRGPARLDLFGALQGERLSSLYSARASI